MDVNKERRGFETSTNKSAVDKGGSRGWFPLTKAVILIQCKKIRDKSELPVDLESVGNAEEEKRKKDR